MKNPFRSLHRREWCLWLCSLCGIALCLLLAPERDVLSLCACLCGATSLIFIAVGEPLGQALTVVFAVLYALVSWRCAYYGEMITYLGMTAPMALAALISWLRHPCRPGESQVQVARLSLRTFLAVVLLAVPVTTGGFFLLRALGTANLLPSTISVTTSFLAVALTFLRTPFYALAYAANDVVLILLWALAVAQDISFLPMLLCFCIFLCNDIYGFFSWRRMQKAQAKEKGGTIPAGN